MSADNRRRFIKTGELLAIRAEAVQKDDRGAFFFLFGPSSVPNARFGAVAIVNVNGPLDYHNEGCGESYDAIVDRVTDAMTGDEEDGAPSCVILRIDSPGGVVAGLDQTVAKLKAMSVEKAIPLYAYVDETAYSAGFALVCACEEVALPRSGFLGSIGVISTMVEQTEADKKMGLRFVVLTSGARKADGHPHVPITDAMIAEEQPRVEALAKQFYQVVKSARGVPRKTIQAWQAKRFLGKEALSAGLADYECSWDEYLQMVSERHDLTQLSVAPRTQSVPRSSKQAAESDMPIAAIDQLKSLIRSETDPVKLAALGASLAAYTKERHTIEKHEKEKSDPEDDEDDEDEDDEEASGDETDRSDDPDDDEDDSDDDDGDDDKKKSESKKALVGSIVRAAGLTEKTRRIALRGAIAAALSAYEANGTAASKVMAVAQRITRKRGASAVSEALEGMAAGVTDLKARMATIEKDGTRSKRSNAIATALNARRITRHEAKELGTKKFAFVEQFLSMRTKAIVNTDEDELESPMAPGGSGGGSLPAAIQGQIDRMVEVAKAQGVKLDPKDLAAKTAERDAQSNGVKTQGRVI